MALRQAEPRRPDGEIHTDKMGERFVPSNGRNKRSVWTVLSILGTLIHTNEHALPPSLKTWSSPVSWPEAKEGDVVMDPFAGSGTVANVALKLNRHYTMIELNPDYIPLIREAY